MLEKITFKTEIEEIITVEEIVRLFDPIKKKHELELTSLCLFPKFYQIRKEIIDKTIIQRNAELTKLLSEIVNRKQEIKINIWQALSDIVNNQKIINDSQDKDEKLEQMVYEAEQIINVYENSIQTLDRKEKRIMSGKYSRLNAQNIQSKARTLKKHLEELKDNVLKISLKHNNCFKEFEEDLQELILASTRTQFTKKDKKTKNKTFAEQYSDAESITIVDDENQMSYATRPIYKDFYLYEPKEDNLDDELIYQLLSQGKYNIEDGTINKLIMSDDTEYYEI